MTVTVTEQGCGFQSIYLRGWSNFVYLQWFRSQVGKIITSNLVDARVAGPYIYICPGQMIDLRWDNMISWIEICRKLFFSGIRSNHCYVLIIVCIFNLHTFSKTEVDICEVLYWWSRANRSGRSSIPMTPSRQNNVLFQVEAIQGLRGSSARSVHMIQCMYISSLHILRVGVVRPVFNRPLKIIGLS